MPHQGNECMRAYRADNVVSALNDDSGDFATKGDSEYPKRIE